MKYALSAAAFLRMASMVNGQVVKGDNADELSGEDWATVQESANLTYSQTFTGYDVSSSFPGEEQDGWELRLAVKDHFSGPDDKELTASTISLTGPDGEVEFDDSWRLCLHVFPIKTSSAGDGFGSEYEPTCEGMVAPECVDDLRKRGIDRFGEGCPSFDDTPSCLRDMEEGVKTDSVDITSDNASRLIGNETSFFRLINGEHDADEEEPTTLLEAAALPHAVISVWGPSGDSDEDAFAQVVCMLPNTVEGDSYDPNPEDAASGIAAFAGWALLSAAVAFQLL